MQNGSFEIRQMQRREVDLAVEWAAQEGWNPGIHDADCYYGTDPGGFLIGLLAGEPIASISVVKYGMSFGFLGFYIVSPEARGRGYGMRIWNEGLKYLAGRNIGLDGVVDQQDNYKKSGFKLAYRNIRFQGVGGGECLPGSRIVNLDAIPFPFLEDYDRPFFPDKRNAFLRAWVSQPESHALGIEENGRLCGYGVIRPCRSGYKIGPLFADSEDGAEELFVSLKSRVGSEQPVFLDVPEINGAAVALAERHGFKAIFETARMYNMSIPDMPMKRIFGITSFEVG